jgi:hypothetical protein
MDLTSGYHQAPLAEESQPYTTFHTPLGRFQWTRVPIGTTDSPKYFQEALETEVLTGLVNVICALYIDDLIIFASSEEEFLERIDMVIQRLGDFNVTLNPKKCKFGLSEVQYLGHTIDNEGKCSLKTR